MVFISLFKSFCGICFIESVLLESMVLSVLLEYFEVAYTCFLPFVQLMEQYGGVWHHSRVRRYLSSEDWPGTEAKGKPWYGLLMLLRKYPEHFVINTRSKGRVTLEFVSLVSLLS